ncbi:MAG: 23S rRNA (guanosine(2251)-2'-O)-methyltransferase RlmB [Deltaproteobacteria bacterium]|nr:23S rRNA (guanosine(2251)-2'-O)-methyltransferase RlmB [Deltaproteobacteria bacterium]
MKPLKKQKFSPKAAVGNETESLLIPGYHAVKEAIDSDALRLKALWITDRKPTARLKEIISIADARKIPVHAVSKADLKRLFPELAHQGIVAVAEKFAYADLDHIMQISREAEGYALLVAADHITDEGNLGALVRTAAFFGAQGLIIPKDRSARMTSAVLKRSSGAYVHLPVAMVVNLGRALERLDKNGFWIIGTSGDADHTLYDFDWNRDVVLVVGNEQKGLSRTAARHCHQLVGIPRAGRVESLNVAVAAGVVLSEIVRQQKNGN